MVETVEGVCFGSAKFKLLISAMVALLRTVVLVVVGLLLPPVVSLLVVSGSCTLISLSSGVGALPIDSIVVVVAGALPFDCIVVVVALPEDCIVVAVVWEVESEDEGFVC